MFLEFILSFIIITIAFIVLFFLFKDKILFHLSFYFMKSIHAFHHSKRPKRILLVRHGQSQANIDVSLYETTPDNRIPLTEQGKNQAREAGKKIKSLIKDESVRFYVSPYKRTRQTYNCILESLQGNKHFTSYDNRVREQEYGNLHKNMDEKFEEMKKVGEFYYRFENGENGADVFNRAELFLYHLFREINHFEYQKKDNIIIVSHDLFIRVFMLNFLKLDISIGETIRHPRNCEFWVIELQDNGHYKVVSDIFDEEKAEHLTIKNLEKDEERIDSNNGVGNKVANKGNFFRRKSEGCLNKRLFLEKFMERKISFEYGNGESKEEKIIEEDSEED